MPEPLSSTDFAPVVPDLRVVSGNLREIPATLARNSRNASTKWDAPKSSREIAEILVPNPETANSVENFRRNVANWYPVIRQAYCWLPETDLRSGSGKGTRYTPFCCEQMEALMLSTTQGRSYEDWIVAVHQAHAEDYAAYQADHQEAQAVQGSKPVEPAQIPLEGELFDPVRADQLVTLNQTSYRVGGSLVNVSVGSLNITVQSADTSPIQAQTQQYKDLANQAAAVLNQGLIVRTGALYDDATAQIENAIAGMQANALLSVVQKQAEPQAPGKPDEEGSGTTS